MRPARSAPSMSACSARKAACSSPGRASPATPASAPISSATAQDLFEVVGSGAVQIRVNQTFPLRDAAAAHIALEARKTTGSTVLLP